MKLVILIAFVVLMMDPCHIEPRALKLDEVAAICASDHPTKYVKLQGRLLDTGVVECRDMPGGVHCELLLVETLSGTYNVRVFVKGTKNTPELIMRRGVTFSAPADWNSIAPVKSEFDKLTVFDSDGVRIDHLTERVELAGTLRSDKESGECSLHNIQRIRRID